MAKTLLERFNEKFIPEPNSGCWLWLGTLNKGGYGDICRNGRVEKHAQAHRVAYELYVGPIPAGLDLDHLCRVRCCVNPAHLEPVTRSENVKRGLMPAINRARAVAQTHCVHGHEFTAENTIHAKVRGRSTRECRECRLKRQRTAYHAARCA
jgi:hypothetical protein